MEVGVRLVEVVRAGERREERDEQKRRVVKGKRDAIVFRNDFRVFNLENKSIRT